MDGGSSVKSFRHILWIRENLLTAGFSQEAFPGVVHPFLSLFDILFLEMAEPALKLQIFFNGNDMGFFLNRIKPSILDLVKGKDS